MKPRSWESRVFEREARTRKAYAIADFLTAHCPETFRHDPDLEVLLGMPSTWWTDVAANAGQKPPSFKTIEKVLSILQHRSGQQRGVGQSADRALLPHESEGAGLRHASADAIPEHPALTAVIDERFGDPESERITRFDHPVDPLEGLPTP
jgi:hypothetical protein